MTRQRRTEEGTVSVEFAIGASILLLVVAATIAAGRIVLAHGAVTEVTAAAARSASIARTASQAQQDATTTAQRVLAEQRLRCQHTAVSVDTSGFTVPVGQPAVVRVNVLCIVTLGDLALPGLPGTRTLEDSATSPLDPFRGRT
jgi:Flp pilus assembly protein TadG